jgi:DNA-binding NarL/FixJ family response regulator
VNRPGDGAHGNAGLEPQALDSEDVSQSMHALKTYIVEDSPVIRENLIATLEELVPVEVVGAAADESTAVQWLSGPDHRYDLVIVDIFLKAGSGLNVLRAVNGLPQPCKLVVLSNYATQDIRRKCLELGAARVFDKSNEIDALIHYCARLAAGDAGHSGHSTLA